MTNGRGGHTQTLDQILEERRAERESLTTLHDLYERMRGDNPDLTPAQFRLMLTTTITAPLVEPVRRAAEWVHQRAAPPTPVLRPAPTETPTPTLVRGVPTPEPPFGRAVMRTPTEEERGTWPIPQEPRPWEPVRGIAPFLERKLVETTPGLGLRILNDAYEAARAQNPSLTVRQFQAAIMTARSELPYGVEPGPTIPAEAALNPWGGPSIAAPLYSIRQGGGGGIQPALTAEPYRPALGIRQALTTPLIPGPLRELAGRLPLAGSVLERGGGMVNLPTVAMAVAPELGGPVRMAAALLGSAATGEVGERVGLPRLPVEVVGGFIGYGLGGRLPGAGFLGPETAAVEPTLGARVSGFTEAGNIVTGDVEIIAPTRIFLRTADGTLVSVRPSVISGRYVPTRTLTPEGQPLGEYRPPAIVSARGESIAAGSQAKPIITKVAPSGVAGWEPVAPPLGQMAAVPPAAEETAPSLSQAARNLGITKDALSEYEDRAVYRLTEGKTVMGSGQQGLLVTPIGRSNAVTNALVREWGATAGSLRKLAVSHEADLQWAGILRNQAYTAAAQSFGNRLWQPAGTIREFAAVRGDAPDWLGGTLPDIVERADTTYAGVLSKQEAEAIRNLMDYQNADLRTLQSRGIPIGTWNENYVRHAYAGWLERNGLAREGMGTGGQGILGTRKGPTIYEWWSRTSRGSAVWENAETGATGWFPLEEQALKVGDTVEQGTITRIVTEPMKPDTMDFGELLMSRFEQAANLRATKDLLDAAAPAARDGSLVKVGGWREIQGLPGYVGDMPIQVRGAVIPASQAVWRTEVADSLQKMLVGAADPGFLKPVMAVRDFVLNLDASMFTLIGTRYPLAHPIDWITHFKDWAGVIVSPTARREWMATSQDVRWFVRNGGQLFQKFEYTTVGPNAGKMATERWIPGLKAFNDAAYEGAINFGAVRSAKLNFDILKAIRGGMRMVGFGEGEGPAITKIPPWQIAQMTDKELSEHAVRSAMDAFAKVNPAEMHLAAGWYERATILTPRFLRSHVALLGKTPTALMGDPEGILNTWFLMQYVAGAAGLAEAVSRVSGQHTSLDPRDVNFIAMRVSGGWFSMGGQIRTLTRAFANIPGDIAAGYYDRLAGMAVSRLNWPLAVGYEQAHGAQMFGQPLKTPQDRLLFMAQSVLPIVAQGVIDEETRPTLGSWESSLAFEWLGGAYWPAPLRESLDRISQEDNGCDWAAATPAEHQLSLANHPDVAKLADAQLKEALSRNQPWARMEQEERKATDDYNARIDAAWKGTAATPEGRGRFVDYVRGQKDLYLQQLRDIETRPEYTQVMEGRQQRLTENPALNRFQQLSRAYGAVVQPYEGPLTPDLQDERNAAVDAFFAKMSPADQLIWQQNTGLYAPEAIKSLRGAQTEIAAPRNSIDGKPVGYWDIGPTLWERAKTDPRLAPFETYHDYVKSLGYSQDAINTARGAIPALAEYLSKSRGNTTDSLTDAYRRANPDVDAQLAHWGYVTTVLTSAAQTKYQQMFNEKPPRTRGQKE